MTVAGLQTQVSQIRWRLEGLLSNLFLKSTAQFDGELNFERLSQKPNCKFMNDEDTAFRVSNLWAHQEIERWLPQVK